MLMGSKAAIQQHTMVELCARVCAFREYIPAGELPTSCATALGAGPFVSWLDAAGAASGFSLVLGSFLRFWRGKQHREMISFALAQRKHKEGALAPGRGVQ